jgi:S-DNA-T family DNA segregation ATPase FtsK/SpoIIIE
MGFSVGSLGMFIAKILRHAFGIGAMAIPVIFIIIGLRYIALKKSIVYSVKFWGLFLLYFLLLAISHYFIVPVGEEIMPQSLSAGGGLSGGLILFSLRKLLGVDGSVVMLIGLTLCAVLMVSAWSLLETVLFAKKTAVNGYQSAKEVIAATRETFSLQEEECLARNGTFYNQDKKDNTEQLPQEKVWQEPLKFSPNKSDKSKDNNKENITPEINAVAAPLNGNYSLPPLTLLKRPTLLSLTKAAQPKEDNSRLLEQTLASFGVQAKVVNTSVGPVITRYEIEPALGVKVNKIVGLADDIALKLAASGIRIEAPIPGKAAVGIEVPNKKPADVFLSEVLAAGEFKKSTSPLTVALGKDIAGNPVIADLAKMPHLLVAGSTGSGKSVCVNTIISSILFKATPAEAKFILIDPKMVELSNYNGIAHLLTPVVTDAKKAASALNWAVNEMERRYTLFVSAGVRDIFRYNELNKDFSLPLIVIIIDELADLMMVAPGDVEDSICRLAQKARAAGIHLVLATQRPSVNVITGTIKANVPSRISFAVSSQIDSRTVLDMAGAEKLLGKGDMLFYPAGATKPLRVQCAFVSDAEIEKLASYIKGQGYQTNYTDGVTAEKPAAEDDYFADELLEPAIMLVLETRQASVAMLQRKFRIGYTRAARLIDTMENMAIVGVAAGSRPREILLTLEEVQEQYLATRK